MRPAIGGNQVNIKFSLRNLIMKIKTGYRKKPL